MHSSVITDNEIKFLRDNVQSLSPIIKISGVGNIRDLPWFLRFAITVYIFYATYFPLSRLRRKGSRLVKDLIGIVDELDQRKAAEFHAVYERLGAEMERALKLLEKSAFPEKILKIVRELLEIYKRGEKLTFEKAYPNYDKSLTKEQDAKIKKLFKGWEEDWGDEKMNVYND